VIIIANGQRRVFDVKANEMKKTALRKELSKLEAKRQSFMSSFDEKGMAAQETMLASEAEIKARKDQIKAELQALCVFSL